MVVAAAVSVVAVAVSLVAVAVSSVAAAISLVTVAVSSVAAAISLGSPGTVLPAVASQNIRESALRGTEIVSGIISGTKIISGSGIISAEISLLEIPLRMITPTTGSIIRTTAIMTTLLATIMTIVLATIPMTNPLQPKGRLPR